MHTFTCFTPDYFSCAVDKFVKSVNIDWKKIDEKALDLSIKITYFMIKYYHLPLHNYTILKFCKASFTHIYLSLINRTRTSKFIHKYIHNPPLSIAKEIVILQQKKCLICHVSEREILTVHHTIHQFRGGTHDLSNLVCVCGLCHSALHTVVNVPSGFDIVGFRDAILATRHNAAA
jgi:hypothetical protein